ncbi:MAG: cbb3-type cytochrome c oxidase subunit I [Alphaproteobacteria bacterium]
MADPDPLLGTKDAAELRGWAGLAMLSLAIAGVFALLLALSRTPGVQDVFPWPLDFFQKGLVIHVVFSFVVWFLAVLGALLHLATVRLAADNGASGMARNPIMIAAYASCALLFIPAFLDRGEASLNNYIPAISDPLYYAGLVLLGTAVALKVLGLLIRIPGSDGQWKRPFVLGVVTTGLIYLAAVAAFTIAFLGLGGQPLSYDFNENLFWGGGHILQYANTALLLIALYQLGRISLGRDLASCKTMAWVMVLLGLYALIGLSISLTYGPDGPRYFSAFTDMQYGLAAPTLLFAVVAVPVVRAARPLPWRDPAFLCLATAPLVFAVGGFLGLFVDGNDTRTPAHYHGVIAAINLSFMGLFYGLFLPLLGRELNRGKALYAQIFMFAGGQTLAAIGLFLAGGYGTPRKTAGGAQGLEEMGAIVGMVLNGIGALIAIIGGVMFIWMVSAALLRPPSRTMNS